LHPVGTSHQLHIHFSFTTGDVIFLIHIATVNQLYCLKMTL